MCRKNIIPIRKHPTANIFYESSDVSLARVMRSPMTLLQATFFVNNSLIFNVSSRPIHESLERVFKSRLPAPYVRTSVTMSLGGNYA